MHKDVFRSRLQSLGLTDAEMDASISLAERFEAFVAGHAAPGAPAAALAFSRLLIDAGENTPANYLALVRYCAYFASHEMYVAVLELVDGGEASSNLFRMVGERFGVEVQRDVFAGIGVAPYGTPSQEKPAYLLPAIDRLGARVGQHVCHEFLSACLRDLPEDVFIPLREEYRREGDVDKILRKRRESFIGRLEECMRDNRPFFAQVITPEVIAFVRDNPEMGGGRREGAVIYETKIPYMTREYLAENDPRLKRYHACHCPWAREAIKDGSVQLSGSLCYCSGGYHKKPWEVILGQPLKVEVLESALKGDFRCRFAIHLPPAALVI